MGLTLPLWTMEWVSSPQTSSPAPRFLFLAAQLSRSNVPPLPLLHPLPRHLRSCSVQINWRYWRWRKSVFYIKKKNSSAHNRLQINSFGYLVFYFFRCAGSFSEVTAPEGRQIAASLIPLTARWLTPPTTQSLFAWTTSRAAAPERSASIFTRLHTCRPKSNPVNSKSVRQGQEPRPQLQPW